MATARMVLNFVQQQVLTALATVSGAPVSGTLIVGGPGWPPVNKLQDAARQNQVAYAVYDRGGAKRSTRWSPISLAQVMINPAITSFPTTQFINPGNSSTVTLTPNIIVNDAVSLLVLNGTQGSGAVATAVASSSPNTMAAALVTAINANPIINPWANLTVVNSVITVTNITNDPIQVLSYYSNIGSQTTEFGREIRGMQVVIWCPSEILREIIGDAIAQQFMYTTANYGGQLADGTYGRFMFEGDILSEVNILKDLYRRDFLCSVEYGVTFQQALYPVLAPFSTLQVEPPANISANIDYTTITYVLA